MGSKLFHVYSFVLCTIAFGLPIFSAEARVFNINEEFISSYFKASVGSHGSKDAYYEGSAATGTELSEPGAGYLYSGELGFMFSGKKLSFRIAGEYLSTMLNSVSGKSASGVEYYKIQSQVQGLIPKVGLDLHIKQWATSRLVLSFDAGTASLTLNNQFDLTAAGEAALGVTDFKEQATLSAISYEMRMGYESLLTDTTTFHIDLGYRQLQSTEAFKSSQPYTGFDGATAKGAKLQSSSGAPRKLNLDGINIGIGFKFYL